MVIIMWTSISKKMYVFMLIILIIGIITGIVFVIMLDEATKEILFLNINEFLQNFSNTNINSGLMCRFTNTLNKQRNGETQK